MIKEITWSKNYHIGFDEIDVQHKHLVELTNRCIQKVNGKFPNISYKTILTDLLQYTKWHFSSEESLMQIYSYSDYLAHKTEHDALIKSLEGRIANLADHLVPSEVALYLFQWFGDHSFKHDTKLGLFMKSKWR